MSAHISDIIGNFVNSHLQRVLGIIIVIIPELDSQPLPLFLLQLTHYYN